MKTYNYFTSTEMLSSFILFVVLSVSCAAAEENNQAKCRLEDYVKIGETHIVLPAGRFTVGPETLKLPANTRISGQGKDTVIIAEDKTGIALEVNSDSLLENLVFYAPDAVDKSNNPSEGLIFVRGRNISFVNLYMHDIPRTGIVTSNANNVMIRSCRFENIATAINLLFTDDSTVIDNTVMNASKHGIQFWGNWKWERIECNNLKFIRNTVINGGDGAIWGSGGKRIVMSENIIDGAHDVGLDLEWCYDSVISSNVVRRARNGGIALFFSCENISITGNSIVNDLPISQKDADAEWWVRSGIWLTYENKKVFKDDDGHKNVIISGNSITCAEGVRRAIWIAGGQNIRIGDNVLRGGKLWYGGRHGESLKNLRTSDFPTTINPADLPAGPVEPASNIYDNNLIRNGDFSLGMAGWNWNSGKADANGNVVTAALKNSNAFELSNSSSFAPNIYSILSQKVKNLKPSTQYRISFKCKGENVKGIWFGGGTDWKIRKGSPVGTYNWQRCQAIITTGPNDTDFEFMIVSEDITKTFLVTEIRFMEE